MRIWEVLIEHYDDDNQLTSVEVVLYDNKQTAQQHAERDNATYGPGDVRSDLRPY